MILFDNKVASLKELALKTSLNFVTSVSGLFLFPNFIKISSAILLNGNTNSSFCIKELISILLFVIISVSLSSSTLE